MKQSKITKKHKLYFRDKKGTILNLNKKSLKLAMFIIDYFLKKGGNDTYAELNKDVTHWANYMPLDLVVPSELYEEFKKVTDQKTLVVSYNGSWRPLANLITS